MTDAQSIAVEAVEEFAAMLDAAEEDPDCVVFDHSPEEIGLHVMENHQAIRAAIAAMPAPPDQEKLVGELVEALENIFAHFDRGGRNGPGHCHDVAGVWDADNGPGKAGTPCDWCAQWNAARSLITRARTQAKGAAS